MIIKNICVEEGFLDGLNLTFSDGLNVLIGPRGSGKTSVIELIRYCLNVPAFSDKARAAARNHALSILGSGRVTMSLVVGGETVTVTRSADQKEPKASGEYSLPTILSQNEVEAVGLQKLSRLKLLDGFRGEYADSQQEISDIRSYVSSLVAEIRVGVEDLSSIDDQIQPLSGVLEELKLLENEQSELLKHLEETKPQQEQLRAISSNAAAASVRSSVFDRTISALESWQKRAEMLRAGDSPIEEWPESAESPDPLKEARAKFQKATSLIGQAINSVSEALRDVEQLRQSNNEEIVKLEDEARKLRKHLESMQKGAGEMARRVANLREKAGQLKALRDLKKDKAQRLIFLRGKRDALLDRLDEIRNSRFEERSAIAQILSAELKPNIQVTVEQSGLLTDYTSAVAGALRGSNLRYKTLAPALAHSMSPRELADAVESGDVSAVANAVGIPKDRAQKVVTHLSTIGMEEILSGEVDDVVDFRLLVGVDYRSTEKLSTGQRCTTILPILMRQASQQLVVDQPEDNLDNAFIVKTLVHSIRERKREKQLIFSTHNPNIPVLGEADLVVLLGSDGERGFVEHAEVLDDPRTVGAITSVMEGGLEAFERRAQFYAKNKS